MSMTVKEVSKLVGISVRTLHHYDEIQLLKPDNVSSAGYRLYSQENLDTLQQILFYKELDFPLSKIKAILDDPSFDKYEALSNHRNRLLERRNRIDNMIQTIDQTNRYLKGEIQMTNEEKFTGFNFNDKQYEEEAREKWGDKTIQEANKQINEWTTDEKLSKEEEMNQIFRTFAELRTGSPDSEKAQSTVQKWYDYLNSNINYTYTLDVFKGLGDMYVTDERFMNNIDKFGTGTAQFIKEAIDIYVNNQQ